MEDQNLLDDTVMVDAERHHDPQNDNSNTPIMTEPHSAVSKNEDTVQQTEASFQESQQKITQLQQDLDEEKEKRKELQINLKAVTNKWKQVANELNKQRTADKPFHIVTDDFLRQQVEELRYNVRTFAETYFDDLGPLPWPTSARENHDLQQNHAMRHKYERTLVCPTTVQAFIWDVLNKHIFRMYRWPSNVDVGGWLYELAEQLVPATIQNNTQNASELEALRKYHIWRATTADMIYETEVASNVQARWKDVSTWMIVKHMDPVISIFHEAPSSGQYRRELLSIGIKALDLDREISRQAADVCWVFDDLEGNAMTEASNAEDGVPNAQGSVRVVAGPGLTKRGKSSGEGFEEVTQILPPVVVRVTELSAAEYAVEHRGSNTRHGGRYTAIRDRPSGRN